MCPVGSCPPVACIPRALGPTHDALGTDVSIPQDLVSGTSLGLRGAPDAGSPPRLALGSSCVSVEEEEGDPVTDHVTLQWIPLILSDLSCAPTPQVQSLGVNPACQNCLSSAPSVPKHWGTPQQLTATSPTCFQLPMLRPWAGSLLQVSASRRTGPDQEPGPHSARPKRSSPPCQTRSERKTRTAMGPRRGKRLLGREGRKMLGKTMDSVDRGGSRGLPWVGSSCWALI